MTERVIRLHDVSIHGDVDRSAVLAAVERAVAAATVDGVASPQAVQKAIAASVSKSRQP